MTTIRQIITDAYRDPAIIGIGEDPSAEQLTEGLRRLNVLYRSLFGNELGEPLTTVNYGSQGLTNSYALDEDMSSDIDSIYVPTNYRLILILGAATTVYLNPNPQDGARVAIVDNGANLATYNVTVDGNGRHVEDADTAVLNTDSVNREWFYRADTGNWVRLTELTADDESPLPQEFDDFLITLLSFRLNPRYGAETSDEMGQVLKRMKKVFTSRYKQTAEQDVEIGLYRLPSTRHYWQTGNNTRTFNRGK